MSETYIPASALRMAIVMVNAADQCDQAGQWDRDHRRACKHILDWIRSNDYKITCEKAGASDPVRHGRWIPTEYDSYADGAPVWDKWECSECGHEHNGEEDTLTPFCPDCGAEMEPGRSEE